MFPVSGTRAVVAQSGRKCKRQAHSAEMQPLGVIRKNIFGRPETTVIVPYEGT
jgi:hypothetical protein